MQVIQASNSPLTGPNAKNEGLDQPYLYLEKLAGSNETAYIIIDEDGSIGGNPKYIDNDSTPADLPLHWVILKHPPKAPHWIEAWEENNASPIIKIVKLPNDLDWMPVASIPTGQGLTAVHVATQNGQAPRIAISEGKVYGIEYEGTGPLPRTKGDRAKLVIYDLTNENQGDDYVYVQISGTGLVFYSKP